MVELHDWYLKRPFKGKPDIVVEGFKVFDTKGVLQRQRWHSSVIVKRKSDRVVETASGSKYVLVGPCDVRACQDHGMQEKVAKHFRKGFPSGWESLLANDVNKQVKKRKRGKKHQASNTTDAAAAAVVNHDDDDDDEQEDEKAPGGGQAEETSNRRSKRLGDKDPVSYKLDSDSTPRKGNTSDDRDEDAENIPESSRRNNTNLSEESIATKVVEDVNIAPLPEAIEMRTGLPWQIDELRRLRSAHLHCTAPPGRFWDVIARRVASRTAQECYNKWLLMFTPLLSNADSLAQKSSKTTGASKKPKAEKKSNKLAGKNTARYRKQVRGIFQASESQKSSDDAFHSESFQNSRTKSHATSFKFAAEIATPKKEAGCDTSFDKGSGQKAGSSDDDEEDGSGLMQRDTINRDKADYYIVGMAKRRKGVPAKAAAAATLSNLEANEQLSGGHAVSASSDGVKGTVLENGTVKIQYDKATYAYDWSEGSEEEDEGFD